jgi:hypothetical protein
MRSLLEYSPPHPRSGPINYFINSHRTFESQDELKVHTFMIYLHRLPHINVLANFSSFLSLVFECSVLSTQSYDRFPEH